MTRAAAQPAARQPAARQHTLEHAALDYAEWIAAAVALVLAAVVLRAAPSSLLAPAIVAVAVVALATWIAWQDVRTLTIADGALIALAALAVAIRWHDAIGAGDAPRQVILALALDALLPGGLLLAFREGFYRLRGIDGLGLGDVKLAAAGGLLIGTAALAWVLFAASALALVAVLACRHLAPVRSVARDLAASEKLAFGAVLAPAIVIAWFVEQGLALLPPTAL